MKTDKTFKKIEDISKNTSAFFNKAAKRIQEGAHAVQLKLDLTKAQGELQTLQISLGQLTHKEITGKLRKSKKLASKKKQIAARINNAAKDIQMIKRALNNELVVYKELNNELRHKIKRGSKISRREFKEAMNEAKKKIRDMKKIKPEDLERTAKRLSRKWKQSLKKIQTKGMQFHKSESYKKMKRDGLGLLAKLAKKTERFVKKLQQEDEDQ